MGVGMPGTGNIARAEGPIKPPNVLRQCYKWVRSRVWNPSSTWVNLHTEVHGSGQERESATHPWQVGPRSQSSKTNSQAHPGVAVLVHAGNLLGFNLFVGFDNKNTLGEVHGYVINKDDWTVLNSSIWTICFQPSFHSLNSKAYFCVSSQKLTTNSDVRKLGHRSLKWNIHKQFVFSVQMLKFSHSLMASDEVMWSGG